MFLLNLKNCWCAHCGVDVPMGMYSSHMACGACMPILQTIEDHEKSFAQAFANEWKVPVWR